MSYKLSGSCFFVFFFLVVKYGAQYPCCAPAAEKILLKIHV